jgi:hypothetical protein
MKSKNFWENFILIAIVLVIIQTFLDEFSRYKQWTLEAKNILLFAGLFFDLTFSIEFTVRTVLSKKKANIYRYWFYERGWVDFLSSFPLLLLDSGPSVYLLLSGTMHQAGTAIGILNVFKVVKAIRITRILRLVRIIKIFGKIHNVDSKMALHHTASIATIAVFTIICTLMVFSFTTQNPALKIINERKAFYNDELNKIYELHGTVGIPRETLAKRFLSADNNILRVLYRDAVLYSSITDENFKKYYDLDDYFSVKNRDFTLAVSIVDVNKTIAFDHIRNFFIIICTVLAFLLIYTRHFVQTISDVVHILNKGFRKRDYNLQIKIREEFKDEEIYKLAKFYNDAYLPAKMKRVQDLEEGKTSGLSMKDLTNFNK